MRIWMCAVLSLAVLAGCGADGEPVRPSLNAGLAVSSSGVHTYGAIGLHNGPLSILLGF